MSDDNIKGTLSKEQIEKAIEWLKKKWPHETCDVCGEKEWMLGDDLVTPWTFSNGTLGHGNAYPQFVIMCQSCGNTKYFNALISGIIKRPKTSQEKSSEAKDGN